MLFGSAPLLALIFTLFQSVCSHSWVERLNIVEANRHINVAPAGYCRGNGMIGSLRIHISIRSADDAAQVLRNATGFSNALMTYQLPPDGRSPFEILPTDLICSPTQTNHQQTPGSPRLEVVSGDTVALQYNENGHITKPWNNAVGKNGTGNVFVYGTNQSQPSDTLQSIYNVWNNDGTGGDRRGQLLFSGAFDDQKCYQYTDEASGPSPIEAERAAKYPSPGQSDPAQNLNLWCVVEVDVPALQAGSLYTLYWVWNWPSDAITPVQPQMYTTCIDLEVVG